MLRLRCGDCGHDRAVTLIQRFGSAAKLSIHLHEMLTRRSVLVEDGVRQPLCADIHGFSLHAAVRVEAHDR